MGEDREISRTENPRVLDILCFSQNLNYIKVCKYIRELLCSPTPPPRLLVLQCILLSTLIVNLG